MIITLDLSKITRFEVIEAELGRTTVVPVGYNSMILSVQDEGRTLKIFLSRPDCQCISWPSPDRSCILHSPQPAT